jgi:uncharacterized protein (DUF885 family)
LTELGPNPTLERLSEDFFQAMHSADPLSATMLGVEGFDALLPDPSREGSKCNAARFGGIEAQLAELDPLLLSPSDRINHAVLSWLAWGARSELEHGLWEANASAAAYVAPSAMAFQAVPTAPLTGAAAVDGYLQRLSGLGAYFDAVLDRYRQATAQGRLSTRSGVLQAIEQLEGHLTQTLAEDSLVTPELPADVDQTQVRARMAELVETVARPAMRRLHAGLRDELLPLARGDDRVGIRFVPGGEDGYRDIVRRHTTTELSPGEIHQVGLDRIATLQGEWSELGRRVLGTSDVAEVLRRLREDPSLRFTTTHEIVEVVTEALRRADAALDLWFPSYQLPPCAVEEISPVEANNAPLAYYRPASDDGGRPAAHCVLTTNPGQRFTYEYEALAFHESNPGHHLQIASARALTGLPSYRRHLDAELCGYIEGWGLYTERLADEMGLYTSDLQRLGMLSFDALRACRLVVDTGMHYLGWSRQQAVDYMWNNTATTMANVNNEIQRYISWPGQALAYMIGCREIRRLRTLAEARLRARFDIREFHGAVLSNGAVPLGVLEGIVLTWIDTVAA